MRINLLPPDVRRRQRLRRQTGAVAAIGVVALVLLGVFFFMQQLRLNGLRDDIEAQQQANRTLEAQIAELRQFDELQQELIATRQLLDQILADEVHWSGLLRDVSLVIPGTVWLTSLEGSLAVPDAATTTGTPGTVGQGLIGQIAINGNALGHRAVALWLSRLEDVEAFANPWASNSQQTEIGATEVAQFSSTVDLSEFALARRPGGVSGS
jgi:Tfp pilus assembly protein PilN